ncbi:ATP-binding cassette domain-containing protein [Streptomyces sp. NPDC020917]|uniref:ATP-binding cassette domain-containing protein n=1 Tax=Streptomyces sp. NPDC020917 TaxID=3365102 RepID=UPI0037985E22
MFLAVAWRAGPGLCLLAGLAVVVSALAPVGVAAAVGAVVRAAPGLAGHGLGSAPGRAALGWTAVAGAFMVLQWAGSSLRAAAGTALGDRVDAALQRDLMDAVLAPEGIAHLEDPAIADLVSVGRDTFRGAWGRPGRLASTVGGLLAAQLTLLGACVLVAGFQPLLGAALLAACLWAAHEDRAASRTEAAHHYGSTETARRLDYYHELGTTPRAAKEVRVFSLSGFLVERFSATWRRTMEAVLTPMPVRPAVATAVLGAVVFGGLAWVAAGAAAGRVGAGTAAVCVQALGVAVAGSRQASWTGLQTELAMASLRRFDEAARAVRAADAGTPSHQGGRPAEGLPHDGIRFENVSFRYPGTTTDVLGGLDLEIPAGRSLAVVGANGAGKTTLVKLLARMYEPSGGRITVDGADLRGLDASSWRGRLAAVFQDAARFALPAWENVGLGHVSAASDREGIRTAAAEAGVAGAVEALPSSWDTVLSPQFADGTDLSGGQWQRLALARALFAVRHGAGVLILDEPAAQLDVRAEARLHERFLELTRGLTTIVISHRFSTVRRASSIAVLHEGRLAEQGTHDELMAREGRYAEMFRLQAARFTDPVGAEPRPAEGSER